MTGAEDVLRRLVARLGDAADFHFARKYVDCIVEEYAGKLATLGAGTCRNDCTNGERTETCHEIEDEDTGFIVCSECGAVHDESYTAYYCWCCGRRIEK